MVLVLINYNNPGDHTFTVKWACLYSLELACRPTWLLLFFFLLSDMGQRSTNYDEIFVLK